MTLGWAKILNKPETKVAVVKMRRPASLGDTAPTVCLGRGRR